MAKGRVGTETNVVITVPKKEKSKAIAKNACILRRTYANLESNYILKNVDIMQI